MPSYDYSSNGYYFITICVKNKEKLLCRVVGGGALDAPRMELTEIGKIAEKYILSSNNIKDLSIEKYIIMPDHIHMLVFIDDPNGMLRDPEPNGTSRAPNGTSRAPSPTGAVNSKLSHMVSTFKRFCNRDIGRNIWQRSFHDHVVRSEKDLAWHYNYVESNPAVLQEKSGQGAC